MLTFAYFAFYSKLSLSILLLIHECLEFVKQNLSIELRTSGIRKGYYAVVDRNRNPWMMYFRLRKSLSKTRPNNKNAVLRTGLSSFWSLSSIHPLNVFTFLWASADKQAQKRRMSNSVNWGASFFQKCGYTNWVAGKHDWSVTFPD